MMVWLAIVKKNIESNEHTDEHTARLYINARIILQVLY